MNALDLTIDFTNSTSHKIVQAGIRQIAQDFLKYMHVDGHIVLEITIVGTKRMRTLNRLHRHIDKPTDVLSFGTSSAPTNSHDTHPRLLGAIVICPDYAAPTQLSTLEMVTHGIMHLLGHDHATRQEFDRWEKVVAQFRVRYPRHR